MQKCDTKIIHRNGFVRTFYGTWLPCKNISSIKVIPYSNFYQITAFFSEKEDAYLLGEYVSAMEAELYLAKFMREISK